jgi:heme/copper-type cytochrome/quinol oxidase subunit 4
MYFEEEVQEKKKCCNGYAVLFGIFVALVIVMGVLLTIWTYGKL